MYQIGQIVPIEHKRDILGAEMPAAWYALQVPRQKEEAVSLMLKAKGIRCCYPRKRVEWKIRGKIHKRKYPEIPSVVYARFEKIPHWDVLKARRLINGVFSIGSVPIALSIDTVRAIMGLPTEADRLERAQMSMIEQMRAREQERLEALRVKEGEPATITGGPFDGFTVDVLKVRDGRVWFETVTGLKGDAPETSLRKG